MEKKVTILVLILLILLPWHSLVINGYLEPYFSPITSWKEVIIIFLFIISIYIIKAENRLFNPMKFSLLIVFLVAICGYFALNPFGLTAIYGFKSYFLPIIFLFAINQLRRSINWVIIARAFVMCAFIMSIFSILQQFILGERVYLNAGYPASDFDSSKLNFAFYIGFGLIQRGAGGFISPIPYSLFLVISLIILSSLRKILVFKYYYVLFITISISLILTFTRSTLAAYLLFFLLPWIYKNPKKIIQITFFSVAVIAIIYNFNLGNTLDLGLQTLSNFWENSTKMKDSSSIGHFESFQKGIEICLENPLIGKGIGTIGPHTAKYLDRPIVLESAYLSVWGELGAILGILFFIILFFYQKIENTKTYSLILVYAAVGFFLPINYYLELTILFIVAFNIVNNLEKNDNYRRQSMASNYC